MLKDSYLLIDRNYINELYQTLDVRVIH